MTYRLSTINYGEIAAGFYSSNTQKVMIGDFDIPTSKFCQTVAELTTGKNSLEVPTTKNGQVVASLDAIRKIVKFGEYEISYEDFATFTHYVFNGGLFGWASGQKPDFVTTAVELIRQNMGLSETAKVTLTLDERI